jgi:hypothetical protein
LIANWDLACHLLWTLQNKEVHDSRVSRPPYQWLSVEKMAKDYKSAVIETQMIQPATKSLVMIQWLPPEAGWVKLNSDWACKDDGRAFVPRC